MRAYLCQPLLFISFYVWDEMNKYLNILSQNWRLLFWKWSNVLFLFHEKIQQTEKSFQTLFSVKGMCFFMRDSWESTRVYMYMSDWESNVWVKRRRHVVLIQSGKYVLEMSQVCVCNSWTTLLGYTKNETNSCFLRWL